jgi:hypothetical protein
MRDCDIARVLLALEPLLCQMTEGEPDAGTVLRVVIDALLGAPPVLAELELALAERGTW